MPWSALFAVNPEVECESDAGGAASVACTPEDDAW